VGPPGASGIASHVWRTPRRWGDRGRATGHCRPFLSRGRRWRGCEAAGARRRNSGTQREAVDGAGGFAPGGSLAQRRGVRLSWGAALGACVGRGPRHEGVVLVPAARSFGDLISRGRRPPRAKSRSTPWSRRSKMASSPTTPGHTSPRRAGFGLPAIRHRDPAGSRYDAVTTPVGESRWIGSSTGSCFRSP